jgi:serine protease AprX
MPKNIKKPDVEIIAQSVYLNDVLCNTELTGAGVKVAVIDTGATPFHPQFIGKKIKVEVVPQMGELPLDFQGHGHWCTAMVAGRPMPTRFGTVRGVAVDAEVIHIKALSTAGFGLTSWILWAMDRARKLGVQVVSMSLGGEQQGSVEQDPLCKAVDALTNSGIIVVVAAGNSGPSGWTIASPGTCPNAITVGSISIMDDDEVSWFSSRGPNGSWYKNDSSLWEEHYAKYGDKLVKPDVVMYGGGRANPAAKPDEVLYQGVTGWFDSFYDLTVDMVEGMHGTSQATPHVAGLIALLKQAMPEITTNKIKEGLQMLAKEKSYDYGWGKLDMCTLMKVVTG